MNKKHFFRLCLSFLLGTGLFLSSSCLLSATEVLPVPEYKASLEVLTGLDRHYNLSFLWFDRLAFGELSFSRDPSAPNRYRALLDAKTIGVAAWLTGDRMQHYETLMEMTPQGRLQPIEYKSMIHKKKGSSVIEHTKRFTFNAATRTIMMTRLKDGKHGVENPIKILGESFPADFLTVGFNYILGVYGPIRAGERKEIVTITDEGEHKIVIEVLSTDDWPETPFFSKGNGTLLKIVLPTTILDTGGGAVYALLDEQLLPQRIIVENVLGLGEVRGKLRQ